MAAPLMVIDQWRRRYHPLHQLRRIPAFRRLARAIDRPIWARLHGVSHPVRLYLFRNGSYLVNRRSPEPAIAALMLAILKTRQIGVFWDIGANIGYYSWLIASASATVKVLGVEPDPTNFAVLIQSRKHAPAVVALNVAVSREDGSASFLIDGVTGATGTIEGEHGTYNRRQFGENPRAVIVRTRSLDSLGAEFGMPDLIKIDVEGHEDAVIDGAVHVLTRRPLILIESFDPSSRALKSMRDSGYQLIGAESLTEDHPQDGNYLAVAVEQASLLPNLREAHRHTLENMGLRVAVKS